MPERGDVVAQWLGYVTGNTHGTRVSEAEQRLRDAIAKLETCAVEDRPTRIKAVRKLAERVLRARLQYLKASASRARQIPTAERIETRRFERAQAAQEALMAGGFDGILREFGLAMVIVLPDSGPRGGG